MKYISTIFLALCINTSFANPSISTISDNNDYLYVEVNTLPIIDINISFKTGSSNDGELEGISNIMLNTLMNSDVEGKKLAHYFENVGANLSYSTNRESMSINIRSLSDLTLVNRLSRLINMSLRSDNIDLDVFELEKAKILRNISQSDKEPGSILSKTIFATVFKNTGLAHDVLGSYDKVDSITINQILNHRDKIISLNNVEINIVGNIKKFDATKIIANLTNGFNLNPLNDRDDYIFSSNTKHIEFESNQSHIAVIIPTVSRSNKDYYNLLVANYIFGGSGFGSWLMEEIREKRGLSYSVYSYISSNKKNGYLKISLQTKNENDSLAKSIIFSQIDRFRNFNVSETDIEDAKNSILRSFDMRTDTNKKLLNLLSAINSLDLSINYFVDYKQKIKDVNLQSIKSALNKSIDFTKISVISVGKTVE